jgi:hypothetical protein
MGGVVVVSESLLTAIFVVFACLFTLDIGKLEVRIGLGGHFAFGTLLLLGMIPIVLAVTRELEAFALAFVRLGSLEFQREVVLQQV